MKLILALMVACLFLADRAAAADAAQVRDRYRAALAMLKAHLGEVRAEGKWTEVMGVKDGTKSRDVYRRSYDLRFAASGGKSRVLRTVGKDSFPEMQYFEIAFLLNDGRYFTLKKSKPKGKYMLINIGNSSSSKRNYDYNLIRRFLLCPVHADRFDLEEIVASPMFKIKRVAVRMDGDSEILRLEFDYSPPDPYDAISGWLAVEPAAHWALREYSLRFTGEEALNRVRWTSRGTITYDMRGADGFPTPVSVSSESEVVSINSNPRRSQVIKSDFRFDSLTWEKTPASEFELAYYGLGGLEGPASNPHAMAVWFYLVGLVSAVFSGVVALRGRSRRNPKLKDGVS